MIRSAHALRLRRRRGRSAFTLVEVVIVTTILALVLAAISAAFLTLIQIERKNAVVLDFATQCMELKRLLRQRAVSARQIVSPDGRTVRITGNDGVVSILRYEDDDNNPLTIGDNRIVFVKNIAASNEGTLVLRLVSPPNLGASPIFRKNNTIGYSPLEIEFVLGDYSLDPSAACHAFTGRGYQSYTFRARVSPRNSA